MICLDVGLKEVFSEGWKNLLFLLNCFAKLPRETKASKAEGCVLYFSWQCNVHWGPAVMFVDVCLH